MKAFVIGFPKAGTSTLQTAFTKSGLKSAHWHIRGRGYVGDLIYKAYFRGDDPFADLADFDAISQADVCLPKNFNLWPNMDFGLLAAIRQYHPECLFILNYRPSEKIAASMAKWIGNYRGRLTQSDIPGLPAGYGATEGELSIWINGHYGVVRRYFRDDPRFIEIDIASEEAPRALSQALGIEIKWWGRFNKGLPSRELVAEIYRRAGKEAPPHVLASLESKRGA